MLTYVERRSLFALACTLTHIVCIRGGYHCCPAPISVPLNFQMGFVAPHSRECYVSIRNGGLFISIALNKGYREAGSVGQPTSAICIYVL